MSLQENPLLPFKCLTKADVLQSCCKYTHHESKTLDISIARSKWTPSSPPFNMSRKRIVAKCNRGRLTLLNVRNWTRLPNASLSRHLIANAMCISIDMRRPKRHGVYIITIVNILSFKSRDRPPSFSSHASESSAAQACCPPKTNCPDRGPVRCELVGWL